MKNVSVVISAAALSVFLIGCEAETLYRADPVASKTVWTSGEEFQTKVKDSLTASIAFEDEIGGTMTFYMVVGNDGADTVLIAPENVYFYGMYERAVGAHYDPSITRYVYDSLKTMDTTFAIDPERQLAGINHQVAQANAIYSTNNGLNAAAALLNLVSNVATIGKNKTDEQQRKEEQQQRSVERSEVRNQANYESNVNQLSADKDYWQNATLRKTTLFPNTAVGGKICFPVDPKLQSFKIIVPIDTTVIEFDFKQSPLSSQ